jgi:hypothetical protein
MGDGMGVGPEVGMGSGSGLGTFPSMLSMSGWLSTGLIGGPADDGGERDLDLAALLEVRSRRQMRARHLRELGPEIARLELAAREPLVQRRLGFVRALLHAHELRVEGVRLGEHVPAAIRRAQSERNQGAIRAHAANTWRNHAHAIRAHSGRN